MSRGLLLSRLVVRGIESPYMKHLARSKGGCSDPVHCLSNLQPTGEEKGPGRVRALPTLSPFPPPPQQGAGSGLPTLFSSYSALEVETGLGWGKPQLSEVLGLPGKNTGSRKAPWPSWA